MFNWFFFLCVKNLFTICNMSNLFDIHKYIYFCIRGIYYKIHHKTETASKLFEVIISSFTFKLRRSTMTLQYISRSMIKLKEHQGFYRSWWQGFAGVVIHAYQFFEAVPPCSDVRKRCAVCRLWAME